MIDIEEKHLNIVNSILKKFFSNYEVWAFGSRVNGNSSKFSDLDIVIIGERNIPLRELANAENEFDESDLPFRVDLIDWNKISKEFQKVIKNKYVVIKKI